jgi:Ca2+/Na+ antiporter
MNILSIISGCFWAFIVIEILVDLMTTIGLICRLSNTFLGLTVLAIGNALPDALTTIVLAKNG